jgi:hypothetical protein
VVERKLVMGIADARMLVDGKEIYTAQDLRCGLVHQHRPLLSNAAKTCVCVILPVVFATSLTMSGASEYRRQSKKGPSCVV